MYFVYVWCLQLCKTHHHWMWNGLKFFSIVGSTRWPVQFCLFHFGKISLLRTRTTINSLDDTALRNSPAAGNHAKHQPFVFCTLDLPTTAVYIYRCHSDPFHRDRFERRLNHLTCNMLHVMLSTPYLKGNWRKKIYIIRETIESRTK